MIHRLSYMVKLRHISVHGRLEVYKLDISEEPSDHAFGLITVV